MSPEEIGPKLTASRMRPLEIKAKMVISALHGRFETSHAAPGAQVRGTCACILSVTNLGQRVDFAQCLEHSCFFSCFPTFTFLLPLLAFPSIGAIQSSATHSM